MPPSRQLLALLLASLVLVLLALNLGAYTNGLCLASADDLSIRHALADPAAQLGNRIHDEAIGRIYTEPKFFLLEHLMAVHSDDVRTVVRLLSALLAFAPAAWFAWEWSRDCFVAFSVLALLLGLLPVVAGYQAFLSFPLLWIGWGAVWVMGALALREESVAGRCLMAAAFGLALASHESNAAFVVWPALVRAAAGRPGWRATAAREFAPCLVVLLGYAALSLALRHEVNVLLNEPTYDGALLSWHLRDAAFALNVYSLSGIPGLDGWCARWTDGLWLTPAEWLSRIQAWVALSGLLASVLLAAVTWFAARSPRGVQPPPVRRNAARFSALLIFAAYAPNLLLALTMKYQQWAHQREWPYYYTSMSFIALTVLGAVLAGALLRRTRGRTRACVQAALAVLVFVLALGSNAAGRQAVAYMRHHPYFFQVDFRAHLPGAPSFARTSDGTLRPR